MSRSLETRIGKLEEKYGTSVPKPIMWVVSFWGAHEGRPVPQGELLGYHVRGGDYIKRKTGESEESVLKRAEEATLAVVEGTGNVCGLLEDRAENLLSGGRQHG